MTKQRTLLVLLVLILIDLVLANQNWFFGAVGEAETKIAVTGVGLSKLLSPLLILILVSALVAFYVSGKVATFLLSLEAIAMVAGLLPMLNYLLWPDRAIAASGQIEKITGQTGTLEELSYQVLSPSASPAVVLALIFFALTALWLFVSAVYAWRWKKQARVATGVKNKAKGKKSAFDLWDSQRG